MWIYSCACLRFYSLFFFFFFIFHSDRHFRPSHICRILMNNNGFSSFITVQLCVFQLGHSAWQTRFECTLCVLCVCLFRIYTIFCRWMTLTYVCKCDLTVRCVCVTFIFFVIAYSSLPRCRHRHLFVFVFLFQSKV